MTAWVRRWFRRWQDRGALPRLLGYDLRAVAQSLSALFALAVASVVAGLVLGGSTDRLDELPGLLLIVPATIALRGNIFGAMGSRLGTSIHAGTFHFSFRPATVVGQNVFASLTLTLVMSLALGVLAKATAVGFGISESISLADFVVISVVGGLLASVIVMVIALALTAGSVFYDLDPDNVTAPLVTAAGDVVTLPALLLAARIVDRSTLSDVLAVALAAVTAVALAAVLATGSVAIRQILRESIPVLVLAGLFDLLAGLTVEKQLADFGSLPALLVFLPGFLAVAGALGGILSSRLSTKLHLGLIGPAAVPTRPARTDIAGTFGLALPGFAVTALLAHLGARSLDLASPGIFDLLGLALVCGAVVTVVVAAVAYYGTIAAVRFGVDPDTYGIPLVTSVLDLVGAFVLVLAVEALIL